MSMTSCVHGIAVGVWCASCAQAADELTAERAAHERTRERVRVLERALRHQRSYIGTLMAEKGGISADTMQAIGTKYQGDIDAALDAGTEGQK